VVGARDCRIKWRVHSGAHVGLRPSQWHASVGLLPKPQNLSGTRFSRTSIPCPKPWIVSRWRASTRARICTYHKPRLWFCLLDRNSIYAFAQLPNPQTLNPASNPPPNPARNLVSLKVAGQQGAYIAHIINSGYVLGRGGMSDVSVPSRLTSLGQWRWFGDAVVDAAYAVRVCCGHLG
jgi:hypothetical protein